MPTTVTLSNPVRVKFAKDLLAALGLPVTAENIRFLEAWQQAEGTRARFNPLATTKTYAGATTFNTAGVKNYATYEDGIAATAATLRLKAYTGVMAAMRSGTSAETAAQAVAASPWGTGQGVLRVLGSRGASGAAPAAGSSGVPEVTAPAAAPVVPPDVQADNLKAYYGAYSWMLDIPELAKILNEATAKHTPGDGWLEAALSNSDWYKSYARQAAVDFDILRRSKPRAAEDKVQSTITTITDRATALGIQITPERARDIALHALTVGLTPAELNKAVDNEFHYRPGGVTGQAATELQTLREKARAYGVPVSDDTLGSWVEQIVKGTATEDTFDSYIREQAKSLFPSLAGAIDAGFTVRQYADPYLQLIQKELGVTADSVDLTNPKWSRFLVKIDPKTGERTSMDLDETLRTLRSDPQYGWSSTVGAQNMAAAFDQQLGQMFGVSA